MHYSTLSITVTLVASQLGTIYASVNPGQQGHLEVRCQQRHLHTYLSNNNLWRGRHVNRSDPEGCSLSWLGGGGGGVRGVVLLQTGEATGMVVVLRH